MAWVCRNCGIEFDWQPVRVGRHAYCCLGCAQGGPCQCDYARLPSPTAPTALAQRGPFPSAQMRIRRPAPLVGVSHSEGGEPMNPAEEVSDGQEGADRRH
ncbi:MULTISPECIES: hypothetical protein [Thermoflexus]|uniref:hypothetical protein n=1 Tax=Thermoflexus TaxID=1495649 RepID=UPI001C789FB8|nr:MULTISPECIES: hypothetical protein [Thermoflexus]MDT7946764.1 hypothetical protein [Thermoflexus sp.]QWK11319.1 MAG: hypothetical protein KNN16_03330 [Thermoflexus hugenholtzii]